MLPREILKIAMRRYAFFTILGYNFRKIRERIFKVICTYIHNIYTIFEVTGKIRKIKKKMFNMKKIMHPTVNPATFFLDVYARMPSPLLQNPIVCPCGHTGAAVHSSAPQTSCCMRWSDLTNPRAELTLARSTDAVVTGVTSSSFRTCRTFGNKSSCPETLVFSLFFFFAGTGGGGASPPPPWIRY